MTLSTSGGGSLVLGVPLNISADLTMTTGNIVTTSTNILTLTDETVTTTVGNTNSYVEGPMQYTLNSNSATRSTLNFPVGKGSDWRPVILRVAHSTTTQYTYRTEVFNQSAWDMNWTLPLTVRKLSDIHFWDVSRYLTSTMVSSPSTDLRTAVGEAPEITLYFGTNDIVYDGADLVVCKNTTGAPTSWIDVGGTGAPPYSGGSLLSGSVTSTSSPSAFNSFSIFTLGSFSENPLPVSLINFSASVQGAEVQVSWQTETEINSRDFTVERSQNGHDFEVVNTVSAAGNSTTTSSYSITDPQPYYGFSYYRLKQVDLDATTEYSPLQSVYMDYAASAQTLDLQPNPCGNHVLLTPADIVKETEVRIYNAMGQMVLSQALNNQSSILLDLTSLLPGLYLVETGSAESLARSKLIKY